MIMCIIRSKGYSWYNQNIFLYSVYIHYSYRLRKKPKLKYGFEMKLYIKANVKIKLFDRKISLYIFYILYIIDVVFCF
jgi:hypothetical protein